MRPVKLIISAFGPYASEICLNMDKLGDKGLYLITGDTGAGKTTIFDAISYALYGEASGDVRTTDMFRSKYAKDDTPTFVELTFLLRGERYKIRRNPEYMRPSKKGTEKYTQELTKAQLTYPDGRITTGVNAVNEAVKELIGLDKIRFSQIAMIAQGDFMQLLTADTKQRIEIFREMFKTRKYLDLQDKLKSIYIKLENSLKDSRKSIVQYLADTECSPESRYRTSLDNSKNDEGLGLLTDTVELISKIIKEDKDEYNRLQAKISHIEAIISSTDAAIGKAENEQTTRISLSDAVKDAPSFRQRLTASLESYEAERKKVPRKEQLSVLIETKKTLLEQYDELETITKECDLCSKNIDGRNNEINTQLAELEQLQKEQNEYNSNIESLKDSELQYERTKAQLQHIQVFSTTVKRIVSDISNASVLREKAYNASNEYIKERKLYDALQHSYMDMERAYYDGQAGILAERLAAGEPCPVCGSVNHPNKAVLCEDVPDKATLEKLKTELENISKICSELSSRSGQAKGEAESAISGLADSWNSFWQDLTSDSYVKSIGNHTDNYYCYSEGIDSTDNIENYYGCDRAVIDRIVAAKPEYIYQKPEKEAAFIADISVCTRKIYKYISEMKNALSSELTNTEKQILQYNKLCRLIPETEKQAAAIKESISKNERDIEGFNAKLTVLKDRQNALKKKLVFKSKEEALADIDRLTAEKTRMEQAFTNAQEKYNQAQLAYSTLKQRIEDLKKQLEISSDTESDLNGNAAYEKITSRLQALKSKKSELETQKNELQENRKALEWRVTANQRAKNAIFSKKNELEATEKKLIWVKALSDTANGNISGKDRIMFETYVQMTYFDRIIERANTRFMTMTSGQYEMKRSVSAANLRSQSGLEIDITDHYNGSVRSVKSLSGGESFKASLALALGLSDEVQSLFGGIQIDTMFVDEGFGSLDEESLQQAVEALMNLSESNRLVGIISHVGELKERIDKQIVVTKTGTNGSTVQIVV